MKFQTARSFIVLTVFSMVFALGALLYYLQLPYYTKVSVHLDETLLPYVDVSIEGNSYPLIIDLGSRLEMDIYSDTLSSLKKSPYGIESWKTFSGQELSAPTFTIPKCYIGSLCFKKPIVVSASRKDDEAYVLGSPYLHNTYGYLGAGLLKKVNMLFDIKKSEIIFTNNTNKLKQDGYDLANFVKVPFLFSLKGAVIIDAHTTYGPIKLSVDTGCTFTTLRNNMLPNDAQPKVSSNGISIISSNTFSIGGTNFGSKQLYFIDITEELDEIDGFLGMDFIKEHVIYIDFTHHMLYIKPS